MLLPGDPTTMDLMNSLHPPSLAFPFGTDNLGRGVFTRVIYGSRIDLQIALFCVVPAFIIGTMVGMSAGYFGGTTDVVSMRLVDVAVAFPFFVAVIAIVAGARPWPEEHVYRRRGSRLGELRADHPRRNPYRQATGLRAGRAPSRLQ